MGSNFQKADYVRTPTREPITEKDKITLEQLTGQPLTWIKDEVRCINYPILKKDAPERLDENQYGGAFQSSADSMLKMMQNQMIAEQVATLKKGMQEASKSYKQHGYCKIVGLLPPMLLGFIYKWMEHVRKHNYFEIINEPNMAVVRDGVRNDYFFSMLQGELTKMFEVILGQELNAIKPSYSQVYRYYKGSALSKHTSSMESTYNVDLMIRSSPRPSHEIPWPLYMQVKEQELEFLLRESDAVIYEGANTPPWRKVMPAEQQFYDIVSFHFVPSIQRLA